MTHFFGTDPELCNYHKSLVASQKSFITASSIDIKGTVSNGYNFYFNLQYEETNFDVWGLKGTSQITRDLYISSLDNDLGAAKNQVQRDINYFPMPPFNPDDYYDHFF